MKHVIIFSLCLLLFVIAGCDMPGPLFPYVPPTDWDSLWVGSVSLTLSTTNVTYSAGYTGEVGADVRVTNPDGVPLRGYRVYICVSDDQVHIVYANPGLRDTTDSNGHVHFTLRTTESGGRVRVRVSTSFSFASDADTLSFLRQDRQPAFLSASAMPETLYVDAYHPDSTFIGIVVLDGQSRPVPGFNAECSLVGGPVYSCSNGFAYTNATGFASDYYVYQHYVSSPYTECYRVRAGALIDSLCLTFMPWDSRHGG